MKNIRPVACAASVENEGTTRVDISDRGGAIRNSQHVFQCSDSARRMHHLAVAPDLSCNMNDAWHTL